MTTANEIPNMTHIIIAIIAWDTLWLQLAVLPFYCKSEKLHIDYMNTGSIDAVMSYIDSQKLIPALAKIVRRVLPRKTGRQKEIDVEALLNEVDFLPDLHDVQSATESKKAVSDRYNKMTTISGRIWKLGLIHIILLTSYLIKFLIPQHLHDVSSVAYFIYAIIVFSPLITMIVYLFRFDSHRRHFLKSLKDNRAN